MYGLSGLAMFQSLVGGKALKILVVKEFLFNV
jgi:hypothetical protein